LTGFAGVGRKVADCVALFSLDQAGAVPVDVHVWQIACRHLDPSLAQAKSLTPAVYARVGDLFRSRYGERAGWAHCLLFAADLPAFQARLPAAMRAELAQSRAEERAKKASDREELKRRREAKAAAKAAAQGVGQGEGKGAAAAEEEEAGEEDAEEGEGGETEDEA